MSVSEEARRISHEIFPENFSKLIMPEGEHISQEAEIMLAKLGRDWLLKLTSDAFDTAKRNGNEEVTEGDVKFAIKSLFEDSEVINGTAVEPERRPGRPSQRHMQIMRMVNEHREKQ